MINSKFNEKKIKIDQFTQESKMITAQKPTISIKFATKFAKYTELSLNQFAKYTETSVCLMAN